MWLLLQGVSTFNDNQMESLGIKRDEFGLVLRNAKAKKDTWQRSRRLLNADSGTDAEAIRTVEKRNDSFAFVHELKQEMHADLKYVESLEDEIDELESDKAEFSNMFVEFKRISLTGFRSCTSHSRYRSVSKQTTRIAPSFLSFSVDTSLNSYRILVSHYKSLFDVDQEGFHLHCEYKGVFTCVLAIITRIMRRT
ncbi:hypothetical protein Tco_1245327 [Tanacetum coccineum]